MASKKTTASAALFLALGLLFFSLVSAGGACPGTTPSPRPRPRPTPSPSGPSGNRGKCPIDTLKLGVCVDVLGGLINLNIGNPPKKPCCTLIQGLADLEAAVCLCTTIKANILGINLSLPIDLSLLLNYCGKRVPSGFQCA